MRFSSAPILYVFLLGVQAQYTNSSNYYCNKNNSTIEFTLTTISHSGQQSIRNCSVLQCDSNLKSNDSCRSLSGPCFDYRTITNISYCAPAISCSILEPCDNMTHSCTSNASVCIVNSCCSSQAVCLALSATNFCMKTWLNTNRMHYARAGHTATVLPNGEVLVAGGDDNINGPLNTAELYDPVTELWTVTGNMTYARTQFTATLLNNGKVLVTGGYNVVGINSCELYDPVTRRWNITGSLANERFQHTASLLNNGKVLVTGGANSLSVINNAELYDPSTGIWLITNSMQNARCVHTSSVLFDGQVLVTGGFSGGNSLDSAELYDPLMETWTVTNSMQVGRRTATASVLTNGKVLVVGGDSFSPSYHVLTSAELYDPVTRIWTNTGSINHARAKHTATVLKSGNILVTGGYDGISYIATAEIYDASTGIWTSIGDMYYGRHWHVASKLLNDKILITGGVSFNNFTDGADLF